MAGSSVVKPARAEKVESRSLFGGVDVPRVLEPPRAVFAFAPEAKVTDAYDAWWTYAFERQEIYFRRLRGEPEPWTDDRILRRHRFTNVYRAADRVSQYLIRNVIYRDGLPTEPDEVVFRILLFKLFNRIETWETLTRSIGALALADDPFERIEEILAAELRAGRRIYSAAYIMPTVRVEGAGGSKHSGHLALLKRMMADGLAERLGEAGSMEAGFELLRSYPGIGPFLAYQWITDINYSEVVEFSEREFVAAGPGAQEGIRKCFADAGGRSDKDLIRMMMDSQEEEFGRLGLAFQDLFGRPLQLIDCQNVFCEVAKYARGRFPELTPEGGRKRIKQKFDAAGEVLVPFFPPKWGIDVEVERAFPDREAKSRFDLGVYQKEASRTIDHGPVLGGDAITTPVLGLIGETGEVITELKKRAREGVAYVSFRDRLVEELGDLLWYAAALATHRGIDLGEADRKVDRFEVGAQPQDSLKAALALAGVAGTISHAYRSFLGGGKEPVEFDEDLRKSLVALLEDVRALARVHDISLAEVAKGNLSKVQELWATDTPAVGSGDELIQGEQLPREFVAELTDVDGRAHVSFFVDGKPWRGGRPDTLTDNAHDEDGYRFHDVFHFAYAAVLGWSPVTRRLMGLKRKSDPAIDEVEDGARAAAIEEGISALVFEVARQHGMYNGVGAVDDGLLRAIRAMTNRLEVRTRTTGEWQKAIIQGFDVWRSVCKAGGGRVRVSRAQRTVKLLGTDAVVRSLQP